MDELTYIYPLFTPIVQCISSEALLLLHLQGSGIGISRMDRTQNVSYTENESIDVDALETKGTVVLEGT